jgi:hypothetical protein
MTRVVIVLLVFVLLALAVATFAQGQGGGGIFGGFGGGGAGGGAGGGRGMGGPGMGGGGMQMPPAPAMMGYQDFVFVELNSVVYKIDPAQMRVVGALFLLAPAAPVPGVGAAGAPPPA